MLAEANEALHQDLEWHQNLLQHVRVGLAVHAPDTTIEFSNHEAPRILGLSSDQLCGKAVIDPAWRFVREDGSTLPLNEYPVSKVLAALQPIEAYVLGVDRPETGDRTWVLVRAYPEFGCQNRLLRVVVTFDDITERKKAEDERAQLQAQLQQAQKMESVGRLAGGVAHDFNNMLGVILGHTEMAMDQVNPAHALHADLEEVHKAATRSVGLTRQLLAFARKQTIGPRVLDLNDAVAQALTMIGRLVDADIHLVWQPGAICGLSRWTPRRSTRS